LLDDELTKEEFIGLYWLIYNKPELVDKLFEPLMPLWDDPTVVETFVPISLIGQANTKSSLIILANAFGVVSSSCWAKKYKKRIMFLKVQFEKAFDSLSWSFLFSILEQMGFSSKWRTWIHSCLNSTFASMLVNGSPTKKFKIKKGLRQGDSLSPFLFILAVEALNVALLKATNNNIFHGIKVGKDKIHFSRLQFADDALIMGEWSRSNAKNLSRILTCFHLASGLNVNFNKSKLYGIGTSNVDLCFFASTIGGFTNVSKWKSKTLSIGGRLTLIKSVLGSVGVYYFSTFKAPIKVINKLEGIRRNFFWGGSLDDKRIP
ncbi:putative RNA-directed DNA polymerase, eukaryota, reverse transcriptase zinc-binding domain protein, partial [Tanacetum coccineum]